VKRAVNRQQNSNFKIEHQLDGLGKKKNTLEVSGKTGERKVLQRSRSIVPEKMIATGRLEVHHFFYQVADGKRGHEERGGLEMTFRGPVPWMKSLGKIQKGNSPVE